MNKFLKKNILLIIFFIICFNFYSEENKIKKENKNVCFLYYKSKYKLELMKEIENKLLDMNFTVKKDLINNMDQYNPKDFDIVVIFSGIKAFSPYPKAIKYIKKHDYAKNIIYFCAASAVKESVYGFLDAEKIDAISSASEIDNISNTSDTIIKRILEIME